MVVQTTERIAMENNIRYTYPEIRKTYGESVYTNAIYIKQSDEGETIPPYRHTPPEWYGNEDDDDTFNDDEDDNDGLD